VTFRGWSGSLKIIFDRCDPERGWVEDQPQHVGTAKRSRIQSHAPLHAIAAAAGAPYVFSVFSPVLAGRPVLYYCLLREPVSLFVSTFTYIKKNFRQLSETHRSRLPPDAGTLPIREVVRFRLLKESEGKLRGSWLNRFLTEQLFYRQRPNSSRAWLFCGASFVRWE
jgi:hypothetical protein